MKRLVNVACSSMLLLGCSREEPPAEALVDPAPERVPDAPQRVVVVPPEIKTRTPDIEYVPTPSNVVDQMLTSAEIKPDDVLYDLGCGDGRIVIAAAQRYGIRARGFDIDPIRVAEARANVEKSGVGDLVTITQGDLFELDLSPATVISSYLSPKINVRLIPQLEKLRKGSRIVTHDFPIDGVDYENYWTVMAPHHRDAKKIREHYVYLYRAPLAHSSTQPE